MAHKVPWHAYGILRLGKLCIIFYCGEKKDPIAILYSTHTDCLIDRNQFLWSKCR